MTKQSTTRFERTALLIAGMWLLIGSLVLSLTTANAQVKSQTLVGTISDTTCGAKHTMGGDAKQCTLDCVKKMNSKYALVVGDKVYTLEGKEADLEKLAGAKAKVSGTVDGMKIKVGSVSPTT